MEHVDGELFSGFPVRGDSHDQSEDGAMSPLVEGMKRELVAPGDRLDERCPVLFRHRSFGRGIKHIAQCCWWLVCRFVEHVRQIRLGRDSAAGRSSLAVGYWHRPVGPVLLDTLRKLARPAIA